MKNGKAAGHDGVTAEMVKNCAEMLALKYEELLKKIFEFHDELTDRNKDPITPITKPDELKTIENMRPITVFTTTKFFINNTRKNN